MKREVCVSTYCVLLLLVLAVVLHVQAMAAVHALQKTEFSPGWHLKCNNPSAWLMGVVSRALRDM
jgi:hypothetical protein